MTAIGDGIARLDGPEKVTGRAQYAADFHLEGQAHAVLVGATVPSGRLKAVDTSRAEDVPGLLRVLAAGDFPVPAERFGAFPVPPLATRHLPLQDEVIVYHGQPVAMIVAETLEAAEEAAAEVRVEIQIEPSANPERAQPEAPYPEGYGALGSVDVNVADIDAAVRNSPVVVTGTYVQPSRHNNPIEPSAILAVWEDDGLTIYDSVQHLYAVQAALAAVFDIETSDVRVVSSYTGGGFGAKAYVWPHEILAAMAARILDKPIKLVLTRAQMYSIVGYQPWMTQEVTLAAEANGTLTGIRHDVTNITAKTDDYVEFGSATSSALYRSPAISTSQRIRRGHINLPTFMRSPIDGPGTWALGSAMDELARATGTDPLDLRLLNYADLEPATGRPWSSKRLVAAYGEGARRFGWRNRPRGGSHDDNWSVGAGWPTQPRGNIAFPRKLGSRLIRRRA